MTKRGRRRARVGGGSREKGMCRHIADSLHCTQTLTQYSKVIALEFL